jgi:uncharacterized RDD family membrane protein YckC
VDGRNTNTTPAQSPVRWWQFLQKTLIFDNLLLVFTNFWYFLKKILG